MRKIIFLFVFIVLSAIRIDAQSGKEILSKLQNKIKVNKGFSAEFVQSFITPEGKSRQNMKGKFLYGLKDRFSVETKTAVIVSDGKTIWNYNKTQKQVLINKTEDDPSSFSIERYLFVYPSICNVTSENDPNFKNVIKLVPKKRDLEFSEVIIYADENYQIKKILINDTNDNKYLLELSKVVILETLTDDKFKFEIPSGVRVIDLR